MQEHWIHSWGKREIEDFMDILDFKSHIKCFDDNILMDPLERRRGQAGVAICYNKNIANLVDKLPGGGNRVVAIRINTEKPIVIICVYLPTQSHKITKDDYIMVLDELAEIVTKYRNSSNILIGGDVNASIHRSKLNSRDNDFQKFLMELNLKIPTMCLVQSTFYHFNNRDESQIDYFVESVRMVEKYITFQRESLNTS
jgi:exonuclease III